MQTLIKKQLAKRPKFKEAMRERLKKQGLKMSEPFAVDRDCGKQTIAAIEAFQETVLNFKGISIDGIVEPNRKTWKGLNGNVPNSQHIVSKKLDGTRRSYGDFKLFSQFEYGKSPKIGKSKKGNIYSYGCTLTALTMAATAIGSANEHWPDKLEPRDLTPLQANDILVKQGAFSGTSVNMFVDKGAKALGMRLEQYGHGTSLDDKSLSKVISHLGKGYPVLAHVDYKDRIDKETGDTVSHPAGDHWILLVKHNADGSFTALDPAGGGILTLSASHEKNERYSTQRDAHKKGILFGQKDITADRGGKKTREGQQKYIVVRIGLLHPMQQREQAAFSSAQTACYATTMPYPLEYRLIFSFIQ